MIITFTHNNCTFFPEGNWTKCCKEHDEAYTAQRGKLKADLAIAKCVFKKVFKEPTEAILSLFVFIYLGVWIVFSVIVASFFFTLIYAGVSTIGCYFYFKIYYKEKKDE